MKKFIACFLLLSILFMLVSCSESPNTEDMDFIYNGISSSNITSGGGKIYSLVQTPAMMVDVDSGESYDIIRNPFAIENERMPGVSYLFSDEDNLYFLLSENKGYQIIRRNHVSLDEKLIYQEILREQQREILFGMTKTPQPDNRLSYDLLNPSRFAVFDDVLFLFHTERIDTVDLKTGKVKTLCHENLFSNSYGYYRGVLYFITSSYDLFAYSIQNDSLQKIKNYKAKFLLVTPEGLYFSSMSDHGRLYFIDFDFSKEQKISDDEVISMDFCGEWIYYVTGDGKALFRISFDGKSRERVLDLPGIYDLHCIRDQSLIRLVYVDEKGNFSELEYRISY